MYTTEQLQKIKQQLRDGVTPETIATEHGVALNTLRGRLQQSGYRISYTRDLAAITPVALPSREGAQA